MNLPPVGGVLLAAVVGNALSCGTLAIHSLGIVGPPLGRQFGWGSGGINEGLMTLSLTTLISAPMAGVMVDRFGVRPVALISTLLLVPSYMAFSLLGNSLLAYLSLWVVVGSLGAGTLPVTWSRAINNQFHLHKGFALGISLFGTGLSGSLLKPYEFWLVEHWGWRGGFIGLGLLSLISFCTAAMFFFDRPAAAARTSPLSAKPADRPHATAGLTLKEAARTRGFWILVVAVGLAAAGVGGALPNMESILKSKGFALGDVRSLVPITGMAIVTGRLGSSYLIDRIWAPLVAMSFLVLSGLAFAGLALSTPSFDLAALIILLIGLTIGMEQDVAAFLVARYFGPRHYGSIFGVVYGVFGMTTGLAAASYGFVIDRTGSYQPALLASCVAMVGSGLLLLCMGRYTFPHIGAQLSPQVPENARNNVIGISETHH